MGYQPRARAPQDYGHRQERSGHERARAKAERKKQRSSRGGYASEEKHVPTLEEAADRTLSSLRILGSQRFALPPFYEYFDRWLANLEGVLSEFESNPEVKVDERYVKERSNAVSNVNVQLRKARRNEASRAEKAQKLSESRSLLGRIEREFADKNKEISKRRSCETSRLSQEIGTLKEELNRPTETKKGIFGFLKKAESPEKVETTQKLRLAQEHLKLVELYFAAEREQSRDEYEKLKQLVTNQTQDLQKEAEGEEADLSLEHREAACETLSKAVNAFLERSRHQEAENSPNEDSRLKA